MELEKSVPVDRRICFSAREALEWLRPEQVAEVTADLLPGNIDRRKEIS